MAEVLVVEDEDLTRRLLEARLEGAGHVVRTAASITEAETLLARFGCPDVLICDPVMPGGSGLHLVTRLRADSETADLPVVFLSGRPLPGDVEPARALGASYLTKPVSTEALTAAIAAALETVDAAVEQTVHGRLAAFGDLDEYEQELIAELLTAFVQRAPAAQRAAERAMATGDAEALQSAVRRLRTAALDLGAEALAAICAELDARALSPIPVPLAARFRRILAATCRVFAGMAAEFTSTPVDAGLVSVAHA